MWDRLRVDSFPAKDFHSDRPTEPIAQQTINDLKRSTSLITRITARCKGTVAPLEIGRGKIVQNRLAIAQMAAREAFFDTVGSLKEPVHRGIECIGTDAFDVQFLCQSRLSQRSTRKQLGARLDDALGDHGQDQITLWTGFAIEQSRQFQTFDHGQDSFHMPVWQRAFDLELLLCFDVLLPSEIAADQFDAIVRQVGEIGDGFLFDFAAFSVGVHEEMGHVLPVRSLTPGRHYMYRTAWERTYRHV